MPPKKGSKRGGQGGQGGQTKRKKKKLFLTKDSIVRRSALVGYLKAITKGQVQVSRDAVAFLMQTVSEKVRALASDAVDALHKASSSTVTPRTVALVALYKHRAGLDDETIAELEQVVKATDAKSTSKAPVFKNFEQRTKGNKKKNVYPWLIRKSACKSLMPRSSAYALMIIDNLAEAWLEAEINKGTSVLPADKKVLKVKHLMHLQLPKILGSAGLQKRGKGHADAFLPALSSCAIAEACKRPKATKSGKPKSKVAKSASAKAAKSGSTKPKPKPKPKAKSAKSSSAPTPPAERRTTRSSARK